MPIDGVGDLPLEGSDRFLLGLAFGNLLLEVGATLGVGLADLADGHHVDGMVELPVAPAGTAGTATRPPEDTSMGAVPLYAANWSRLVNRATSPVNPISEQARTGPIP